MHLMLDDGVAPGGVLVRVVLCRIARAVPIGSSVLSLWIHLQYALESVKVSVPVWSTVLEVGGIIPGESVEDIRESKHCRDVQLVSVHAVFA